MLTKEDVRGVSVMAPTPCVEGGELWQNTNSVDLEETARMTENLIRDGIGNIAACGTTGECHSLLWEEKVAFIDTMVQVNKGRVPIFAGCTSLGTKETIRQMRAMKDLGAEGAFVGLPLWQTPTIENSVRWFADLSEAVPDMGIMVYANAMFFKSTFPTIFWDGVAKRAPTVITNKIGSRPMIELLEANVRVSGHQVLHQPIDFAGPAAWKLIGSELKAVWSTSSSMGPEPSVALFEAIQKGDNERMREILEDIESVPSPMPPEAFPTEFPKYNVQIEKTRFNAAGYIKAGPVRAPYLDLPEEYRKSAEANGKGWAEMRKKYMKARV